MFNLDTDPREQHNLYGELPDVAAEMSNVLATMLAQYAVEPRRETRELAPEEREALRALGYLE